jgi:hypothetical protein
MNRELPLDSIESAQEFVALIAQVVLETKHDIEADVQREMSSTFPRRLRALQIIADNLGTLELHVRRSCRILNDLRSLRRLLFGERTKGAVAVRPKPIGTAKAEASPSSVSPRVDLSAASESTAARDVSSHVTVRKRALSSVRAADARNPGPADAVPWYVRPNFKPIDGRKTPNFRQ